MVQQGAGENLCQFFLFSCSVPCRLRGAESSQPLPGSRKAQTRQQFREKLQGNACDVRQAIPGPPKYRMVRTVLFPVSTTALFNISELINITDHKVI